MIQILITDDHPIVRQGLKQIISETSDITAAGEADTGQKALDMIRENDYDIILLDISLPDISGFEVLKRLSSEKPELPVLILSIHSNEQYAIKAFKTGAAGYMIKTDSPEELTNAIRTISTGGTYITSTLRQRLSMYIQTPVVTKPLHENLSKREYEVLCLIATGKSINDIAAELSLGQQTISTYKMRILFKFDMKHKTELIQYAEKHGLVDPG
jgi:two-component system, NarL family, invasion response regulator UvrY